MIADHKAIWAEKMAQLSGRRFASDPPPSRAAAPAHEEEMLTLDEAAARMRVTKKTFRKWDIPRFTMGKVVLIRRQDLDEFIARNSSARHDG